jgi:hypothetical protein
VIQSPTLFDLFEGDAPAIVEPAAIGRATPRERAEAWFAANPRVLALLENLALEEAKYGPFGMKYLFEILRFKVRRTWRKDANGFKLNNSYTATAGRLLVAKHPHLAALIETRQTAEERRSQTNG